MELVKDGWFHEKSQEMWPGQAMSLAVEKVLYHQRSKFQDIAVLETKTWGTVLLLDGVIQCTPKDEFSYQEMIAFLPVNSHPRPEKVLVIGGGDGGVVRELSKHHDVKSITLCEIDEQVLEVSMKYLPYMASGFSSEKLTIHIGDGFEFMKEHTEEFDVIITDSSDPVGPAESLFSKEYYQLMKQALRPGGIICCQGECMWLHMDLIRSMRDFCQQMFEVTAYAYCCIPTYPCGQIGFMLCSKNKDTEFENPLRIFSKDEKEEMKLKYYNKDIHKAAFVLPEFARKALED